MKKLLTFLTIFSIFSYCAQGQDDKIETILLNCLTENYQKVNVNLEEKLTELEDYLIEKKF